MRSYQFILLTAILAIAFSGRVPGQAPMVEWQHIFGGSGQEGARSIKPIPNGGYLLAGASQSSNGDLRENKGGYDYWVLQMTSGATLDWQHNYGGSGNDIARSVTILPDSGFIVAGESSSADGQVTNSRGNIDFWLLRCDNVGNIRWQKSLGGTGDDRATSVQVTPDGGCITVGYTNSTGGDVSDNKGGEDYWIVKLDPAGGLQWQQTYGGNDIDQANDIQLVPGGGYIVAGSSKSNDGQVAGNHGGFDYWIIKLDEQGNLVWQKSFGGSNDDFAQAVRPTSDGGYIVAGHSQSGNGDVSGNKGGNDFWVVKLSASGNLQWQRSVGGTGDEIAYAVRETTDGQFIISGSTLSNDGDVTGNHGGRDLWLVSFDKFGTLLWQKTIGGSNDDTGYDMEYNADSTLLIAGSSASVDGDATYNFGGDDFWVVKLAPCIPKIDISASPVVGCTGVSFAFSANISQGGDSPVFQWVKNGRHVGTNSHEYRPASLKVGDSIFCRLTSNSTCAPVERRVVNSNMIVVNDADLNAPVFSINGADTGVCEGSTLQLSATLPAGANNPRYQWQVNGNTIPGAATSNLTINTLKHNDTLVAGVTYHLDTCTVVTSDTVIVYFRPPVTPQVTISGPNEICENDTAQFVAAVSNGGNSPRFNWLVNGIGSGESSSIFSTNSLIDYDTVTCIVQQDSGCYVPAFSNAIVVTIVPAPVVTAIKEVTVAAGSNVQLKVQSTGSGLSYLWTPPAGLSSTTSSSPFASPAQTTRYTLEVRSADGCKSAATITVNVLHTVLIPSAFSPNGDGINDTWMIRGLNAYPEGRVRLFDRYGRLVFQAVGYNRPWDGTTGSKSLPAGAYYYMVETERGKPPLTGSVMIIR